MEDRKVSLKVLKLFILGLPCSGKSSISRHITTYLKEMDWASIHFSDHLILNEMFRSDSQHKQFKPADHGGFDVLDVAVFDMALQRLEQEVYQHLLSAKPGEMILHLDVKTETCKRRIRERIANPNTTDDFYVSEYIFNTYYNKDDGIDIQRIKVIENNGSLDDIVEEINELVDRIGEFENLRGA